MKIKKRNVLIAVISFGVLALGYAVCMMFFSTVPLFSYTAEWTSRHYFLFFWVAAFLLAVFNRPITASALTVG